MISTRNLDMMPNPTQFRRITMTLATLDAIVCPEWEYRYYSFNSRWSDGEAMASMRNGQGDRWFALLTAVGIAMVGLAHESSAFRPADPLPGIFEGLPQAFLGNFLREPAFDTENASFCVWRTTEDSRWHAGPTESGVDDGSEDLLSILEGAPEQYVEFAREYFEVELPLSVVSRIYDHEPLSDEIARLLNPDVSIQGLRDDLEEIGYPIA